MNTIVSTEGGPQDPGASWTTLTVGAQAGPWVIEREIGRGGMGVVYAVVHEKIGKRAALKLLHHRSQLAFSFHSERMLLEGRVVNQVGHPNIVDIFETGTLPDGRPYIVMERLEGQSLAKRAETRIGAEQSLWILREVCDALIAAHAAGVVHRDLKPDNIFLVDDPERPDAPRVKLLDWGIARALYLDTHHTIEGQLIGTPPYLSPEQARGTRVTAQTDVYSLGVVAYELFLGQLPFEGDTSIEVMAKHLLMAPPSPRALWPGIPPRLEALLLAMLAKSPDARPEATEVARRLDEIHTDLQRREQKRVRSGLKVAGLKVAGLKLAGREVPGRKVPRREASGPVIGPRSSRSRWGGVVGALALVACGGLFLIARREDAPAEHRPAISARAMSRPAPSPGKRLDSLPTEVRPAPQAQTSVSFSNPIHDSCADPGVTREGARWYMTCTGGTRANRFPIYESENLQRWRLIGSIFPAGRQPQWASGNYWAPELHRTANGVVAYYSMRVKDAKNAIGVATAPSSRGPFVDSGAPLLAPDQGASDAHLAVAADGTRYLYYRLEARPSSIWGHALEPDGLHLKPGASTKVLSADLGWEDQVVEAPWLLRKGSYYYLFYSGSRYCDPSYAVGVARATTPLGPFEKRTTPVIKTGSQWVAPGHISITAGPDDQLYMLYHAYRASEGYPSCVDDQRAHNRRRRTLIGRVTFDEHGWPSVAPATTAP